MNYTINAKDMGATIALHVAHTVFIKKLIFSAWLRFTEPSQSLPNQDES